MCGRCSLSLKAFWVVLIFACFVVVSPTAASPQGAAAQDPPAEEAAVDLPGYTAHRNLVFSGHDLETIPASAPGTCADSCSAKDVCEAFLYYAADQRCVLKTALGAWQFYPRSFTYAKVSTHRDSEPQLQVKELQLAASTLALHAGEDCFQACGNSSGWCSWCGLGKACCKKGDAHQQEECNDAGQYVTWGYACVSPTRKALGKLGVAHFSFEMIGVEFAVASANIELRSDLLDNLKETTSDALLGTVAEHQVALKLVRGDRGWAEFSAEIMIPNGGPSAATLAESRLCAALKLRSSLNLAAYVDSLPDVRLTARKQGYNVGLANPRVGDNKPCPEDPWVDIDRSVQTPVLFHTHSNWWAWLLLGSVAGCFIATSFLGFCYEHCRHKKGHAAISKKHPHEGVGITGKAHKAGLTGWSQQEEVRLLSASASQASSQDANGKPPAGPGVMQSSSSTYFPALQSEGAPQWLSQPGMALRP